MQAKISALQFYLQQIVNADSVTHEPLYTLHRFNIDHIHNLYIDKNTMHHKSTEDLMLLVDAHNIADILNAASEPTNLYLNELGLKGFNPE